MIKTLTNLFKQDKEKFVVPKGVQDVIPVVAIFDDGIFKVGKDKYSKTYRFTDINYLRILKLINFSKFKGDYGNDKQTYINRTRRIICKGL